MNLSGRLIDAFLALEETRRFAVAAERCHVSPSAFSQMIGRLEQQVGARLFDRTTRTVSLTPEGEVFAEGAHRIATEIRGTVEELRDRAQRRTGRVSVAAPPSLAADWLPRQMALFRQTHPGIALRLADVVADRCMDLVRRGDVDFGLHALSGQVAEFETCPLADEPFYVLCQADDSLAARRQLRLADLQGRPCVQTLRSGSVWQQTQQLVRDAGLRDTGLEVNQLGSLAGLVLHGFGVALVPQSALQLCLRPGLAAVRLADAATTRPLVLVRLRGRSLSVAAQSLWDQLLQAGVGGGRKTPRRRASPA